MGGNRRAVRDSTRPTTTPSVGGLGAATAWVILAGIACSAGCAREGAEGQDGPSRMARPAAFRQVGIIEGFYGTPWSHRDRLDILRFMRRVGMNAYYYAPKNDPYHRQRWRDPYPAAERRRLGELADTARAAGVAFYYSISPGVSITYSDSGDVSLLTAKLRSLHDLGVRHFALMLDDVPFALAHPADAATFETLANAHADLINRVHRFLAALDADLVVTPTTYTAAWGDREYLRTLGHAVPPDIPFFWTGPDVASPAITARDAREWAEVMGRPPLIWDNYPVNDFARWRVFLGPLRGRSADLHAAAVGIISNPMSQAHASMLPLATLASYANAPAEYRAERAIEEAAVTLYGPGAAAAVRPFLELFGDYPWNLNLFEPLVAPGHPIDVPAISAGIERLEESLRALRSQPSSGHSRVEALLDELEPIVTSTRAALERLRRDTTYERRGDVFRYRSELDRLEVARSPSAIVVDGRLDEWHGARWRRLHGFRGADDVASIAMLADGKRLLLALRVRDDRLQPRAGDRVGEGDHVAVVIDRDADRGATHVGREDAVLLFPAPGRRGPAPPHVVSLDFHGFMAKNVAARRNLRFSEFLVSSLAVPPGPPVEALRGALLYGAAPTPSGYTAEIGIPLSAPARIRMTVVVTDAAPTGRRYRFLPVRNFPGNPATFADVLIR